MPPRQPYGIHGTANAPTATIRGPGDRQRLINGHTVSIIPATPSRWSYGSSGLATPHRRSNGIQDTGHTPTAAIQSPGEQPRPYNGHTGPRVPATPPRQPLGAGDRHAPTAAIRGLGERPRSHGSHTGYRGPATSPRRPYGAQETGNTP